jgi:bifunctional enzyme CysN/CysC
LGATVWLTGLSGAGKSTIAAATAELVEADGLRTFLLDGDELRAGLNADLGFGEADRRENVRRAGEVALLLARSGTVVLASVISPYAAARAAVRARHEESGVPFFEVFVATPVEVCEARDPKGLYAAARRGELSRLTGVSDPYEPPEAPDLVLVGSGREPRECALELATALWRAGVLGAAGAAGRRPSVRLPPGAASPTR